MKQTTLHQINGHPPNSFAALLDDYTYQSPKRGQIIKGTVLRIENDALFVDIGAKRDAIVPHTELNDLDAGFLADISAGDEVPVYITRTGIGGEELLVSLEKGLQQEDWDRAATLLEDDEIVTCQVSGFNKGGLLVRFGRLEGFVPNSHVPELRRVRNQDKQRSYKAAQIGESISLKVLEAEPKKERLVLSARTAQKEQRRRQLASLEPGQKITGRVTALVKFGAFVDIGHVDGLIHISKITHQHIDHPGEALEVGEEVEIIIEHVDVERERISLNRQQLLPSPWDELPEKHQEGDLIEGVIENIVDFGLFIRLGIGVVGLAHSSECDLPAGVRLDERFQEGDTILARIIEMSPEEERLGLSLRRVSMREELNWMADRPAHIEA